MRYSSLIVIATSTFLFYTTARANSDQELVNNNLFQSIIEQNIKEFEEYLELGADPNFLTDGETYYSSAFCEATKRGNEKFLDAIVQIVDDLEVIHGAGMHHSPASCAIMYSNISAFRTVVNLGIDVSAVLNPEVPVAAQTTLLDRAIIRGRTDIVFEMIQQSEPTERQITRLIDSMEFFGGFEGHKSRTERLVLKQWLQDRGYEVNLAPPAPDPRTIQR